MACAAASASHRPSAPTGATGRPSTSTWLARSSGTTPAASQRARRSAAVDGRSSSYRSARARSTRPSSVVPASALVSPVTSVASTGSGTPSAGSRASTVAANGTTSSSPRPCSRASIPRPRSSSHASTQWWSPSPARACRHASPMAACRARAAPARSGRGPRATSTTRGRSHPSPAAASTASRSPSLHTHRGRAEAHRPSEQSGDGSALGVGGQRQADGDVAPVVHAVPRHGPPAADPQVRQLVAGQPVGQLAGRPRRRGHGAADSARAASASGPSTSSLPFHSTSRAETACSSARCSRS